MARILIIDDDDMFREMLALRLSEAGHTVTHASDGGMGFELIRAQPADVAVIDLVMPGKEGIETILELWREYPHLPIIAVSGGGLADPAVYLRMAANLGAKYVLPKPFGIEIMLAMINDLLARKG